MEHKHGSKARVWAGTNTPPEVRLAHDTHRSAQSTQGVGQLILVRLRSRKGSGRTDGTGRSADRGPRSGQVAYTTEVLRGHVSGRGTGLPSPALDTPVEGSRDPRRSWGAIPSTPAAHCAAPPSDIAPPLLTRTPGPRPRGPSTREDARTPTLVVAPKRVHTCITRGSRKVPWLSTSHCRSATYSAAWHGRDRCDARHGPMCLSMGEARYTPDTAPVDDALPRASVRGASRGLVRLVVVAAGRTGRSAGRGGGPHCLHPCRGHTPERWTGPWGPWTSANAPRGCHRESHRERGPDPVREQREDGSTRDHLSTIQVATGRIRVRGGAC